MKKEEKLLDALGDVKSSYILECSQYVGNEQKEVLLLKPRKPHWAHFSAVAAVMALFITATLVLLPQARRGSREAAAPQCAVLPLGDGTELKLEMQTGQQVGGFRPVQEIAVYRNQALLQTIDASAIPGGEGSDSPWLFLDDHGQPDIRDLNFDGYTDIGFPAQGEKTDNLPYHYFLWNAAGGVYEYGFTLLGGTALEADTQARILLETQNTDAGPVVRRYRFEDGTLRQIAAGESNDQPDFQIRYDEAKFAMTQGEGGTFIAPLQGVGSYTPVCEIQIEFLPGMLPTAAANQAQDALDGLGATSVQRSRDWDRTVLHVQYGTQWDARVEDIHYVSAGVQGTFRLTARYFAEAVEGYGTTFAQICNTFTPLAESANPSAERAIVSFADGFFSGDWTAMEPYLYDPNGEISHEDVYTGNPADIQTVALRGLDRLDQQIQEDGTGTVSLTFREGEEDSYTYLSMDITKTDSGYQISFYGLEK